jgi:hypothetical protein
MEAASDTTASTLLYFILAMGFLPDTLSKYQEEVDSISGSDRSPTFKYSDSLATLKAAMTEVRAHSQVMCPPSRRPN